MEQKQQILDGATSRANRTRLRIMRVAERLFGEQGINGPSMRQIATAAGQSNASVIQYHFVDKDNLIREIMLARVCQMEPVRLQMLDAAQTGGQLTDLATLLRILCVPHIALRDEDGRFPYGEFMLEFMLRYRGPSASAHPMDTSPQMVPGLIRVMALIRQRLYYIDDATVSRRSMTAVVIFLFNLINASEKDLSMADLERQSEDGILMGVQSLLAPLPPMVLE